MGGELAGRLWVTDPPAEPEPVSSGSSSGSPSSSRCCCSSGGTCSTCRGRLSGDLLGDLLRDGGPDRGRGGPGPGRGARRTTVPAARPRGASRGRRRSRPPCGCPGWPGARPSRTRSRWPARTTGRMSCCCRPTPIPGPRCAASSPRPTRRWGAATVTLVAGPVARRRPDTRPRSGSPAARGAAPRRGRADSWTSAASACPRCCSRRGRRMHSAASPPTCCTPWRRRGTPRRGPAGHAAGLALGRLLDGRGGGRPRRAPQHGDLPARPHRAAHRPQPAGQPGAPRAGAGR